MKRIHISNKKLKIASVLAGSVLLCGAVVFGAAAVREAVIEAELADSMRIEEKVEQEGQTAFGQQMRISMLESQLKGEKQVLTEEEYFMLHSYVSLLVEYQPAQQELDEIDRLIAAGHDIYSVLEVYRFWRTTDCPLSSMEQVLGMKDQLEGKHWVENGYNAVTNNRYGVLDEASYLSYLDRGATMEDIAYANVLCRKGVLTIQQLLDQKIEGQSWQALTAQVDGSNAPALQGILSGPADAAKMMSVRELTSLHGEEESRLVALESETLQKISQSYEQSVNDTVDQLLEDMGITYHREESEAERQVREHTERLIVANGFSTEDIAGLRDQGYRDIDILNASQIAKRTGKTLSAVLEEYERVGNWLDMTGGAQQ